jgi:hypothetical protein
MLSVPFAATGKRIAFTGAFRDRSGRCDAAVEISAALPSER